MCSKFEMKQIRDLEDIGFEGGFTEKFSANKGCSLSKLPLVIYQIR